jgi:hypothetical protein
MKQGQVASPIYWNLYMDNLLKELRMLGLGCHIADVFLDCRVKRARYIDKTVNIRTMFEFAHPEQVLTAIDRYAGDYYGAMLWNLYDEKSSGQYFRCWGTTVKLAWGCPRSTHRYFVNNFLALGFVSIRVKVISRYVNFFQTLLKSRSKEVRLVAQLAAQDKSSTTGINLAKIYNETNINPWTSSSYQIRQALQEGEEIVPEQDMWRLPYLGKLLGARHKMELELHKTDYIDSQIDLLCSS